MNDAEHEILKELEDFTHEHNDDDATNDEKHSIYKQTPDNPARSLSLNYSSKTSIKYPEDNNIQEQLIDKEKFNQSGSVELKIVTPKRSCKFEHNQNTNSNQNKHSNKILHSTDNTNIENDESSPTITDYKYPVIYIPTNLND